MTTEINWIHRVSNDSNWICFAGAFELSKALDLNPVTKELPEGVIICQPILIAGLEHLDGILLQASQHWKRGQFLARNKSIDLLMRVTCKRQISDAIAASGIKKTDNLAIFGLVDSEAVIENSMNVLKSHVGVLKVRDELLALSKSKEKYLKSFHRLPSWLSRDQLVSALKENSALLVLSK